MRFCTTRVVTFWPSGCTLASLPLIPGQALPPVLIERLSRDHARIAVVVRQFGELCDPVTAELDWQQLRELVEFLDHYADHVHHPLEDRLFDRLVNKGLAPTERHLVFRNLDQHQEIRSLTEALAGEIEIALGGGTVDADEFRETAAQYLSLQERHMRFEESHLFPLLEEVFDSRDWNVLMGILQEAPEPDSGA
jgi:hemerythrin-like domain-containing protein